MDKCGAKMKKKKCEDGGIVNIDKCGAKIKKKKCENGLQIGANLLIRENDFGEICK